MLNYLSSEMFRARKSTRFKLLVLVGMAVPSILAIGYKGYYKSPLYYLNKKIAYLEDIGEILLLAQFFLGIMLINFLYKDKHYQRMELASGKHRRMMVIQNLFTLQFLTVAISLLFMIVVMITNIILCLTLGIGYNVGLFTLLLAYRKSLISQLLLNQQLIGLIYLTNSKVLTTFIVVLISIYHPALITFTAQGVNVLIRIFFPYYFLLEDSTTLNISLTFIMHYFANAAIYIIIAYQSFKRREF